VLLATRSSGGEVDYYLIQLALEDRS
jgi:hypothetical protein